MATLNVACAVEGAYDAHSAAMLHSVAMHAGALDLHVHYLHGPGFPARSLRRIDRMVTRLGGAMTAHEIAPARVARLPVVAEFTAAMWYRIFLPELMAEADRVLYLDVDTLAVDDLGPLWATDLSRHHLAAVTNVLMPHHAHRPASLGLEPGTYFNSGVLLMNLDRMRADDTTQALHDYAAERGAAIEWPDQDTLNVVLGHSRLALHPRWNAMNSLRFAWAADVFGADVVGEARRAPGIRHFEGPGDNKPWDPRCERDDRELYAAHRRRTPWPGRGMAARAWLRRRARR
jgi:lipopolysaccharide biosynthesis glycosyltransferase